MQYFGSIISSCPIELENFARNHLIVYRDSIGKMELPLKFSFTYFSMHKLGVL